MNCLIIFTVCVCVPGGVPCPAAAVAIAKAEAGETEQREFSPGWTAGAQAHNYHQRQQYYYIFASRGGTAPT